MSNSDVYLLSKFSPEGRGFKADIRTKDHVEMQAN